MFKVAEAQSAVGPLNDKNFGGGVRWAAAVVVRCPRNLQLPTVPTKTHEWRRGIPQYFQSVTGLEFVLLGLLCSRISFISDSLLSRKWLRDFT